jgi:hypothetical protein
MRRDLLLLDGSDFGKQQTINKKIIDKCLGQRLSDQIKQICVLDRLRVWGRHDNSIEEWSCRPTLWPKVEVVNFSKSVLKSIEESSFLRSSKLREVILPHTVTEIGRGGFYCCTSLKVVKLGNGLKTLGVLAFYDCESLIEIVLPDSITDIGASAFHECSS